MDVSSILQVIKSNPVLTTGAGLGVGVSAFQSLRSVPGTVGQFVKRRFVTTVSIHSGDYAYAKFQEWIHTNGTFKEANDLQIATLFHTHGAQPTDVRDRLLAYAPAPGMHVFKYKGKRIWMSLERDKADNYGRVIETLKLSALGRSGGILKELLQEVAELYDKNNDSLMRVYIQSGSDWELFTRKKPRPTSSVILPAFIKTGLIQDLTKFQGAEERYTELGLPYRRGYLLYGPPGNGKSSIIEALSGHLGYDLYIMSLSSKLMDDQTVLQLMSKVPSKGVLLIEDVDAAFVNRDKADITTSGVTFSGLLNALDGVGTKHGQVVMMSTNHIERLDSALLRPGRTDTKCFIDNATQEQAEQMMLRFFPEAGAEDVAKFSRRAEGCSMARLQGHLNLCTTVHEAVGKSIQE